MAKPIEQRSVDEQQRRLTALLTEHWGERLEIKSNEAQLILSLEPDIQATWQSEAESLAINADMNIMFASDQNINGERFTLTYIVGAALKLAGAHSPDELYGLLIEIGVDSTHAALAADNCEGLNLGMAWSFYRDLHNLLVAVPLMNYGFAKSLSCQQ
ncbi:MULTISPECIES: hypothetical protein [unclassified Synechococcus]|uniref:hypothetical protein n=1 Tax=unclassified Synechococcus TaxID=2626047 RepID=UPI0021A6C69B|nr:MULTISPECIES: hypothetical protein [unclassified Synechococcus]MCT0214077.1 hypothetical protein [Synechococcus sp. CS-1326]MCT0234164.1 hypothetical protein [Synechococcus sp. CS-1327]